MSFAPLIDRLRDPRLYQIALSSLLVYGVSRLDLEVAGSWAALQQATDLASLTGWEIGKIRGRMNLRKASGPPPEDEPWWRAIWKDR